jgi:NAD(P)-dependent dehydrogenase (short-subunit alcohol dehydrogenase family)
MKNIKNVLITGGTGSLGEKLIEKFSKNKCRVTFQYSNNDKKAVFLKKKFNCEILKIDFSKKFNLDKYDYDILINGAGINFGITDTHKLSQKKWTETLAVNLTAPFILIQKCLPHMMEKKWGRIINISSIYGLKGIEGYVAYVATKHGLSGITKTVSREYASYGVTCNEICPGPINSEMVTRLAKKAIKETKKSLNQFLGAWKAHIPMKRFSEPEEIADLVLFLASPKARFITGASIPIDGGELA